MWSPPLFLPFFSHSSFSFCFFFLSLPNCTNLLRVNKGLCSVQHCKFGKFSDSLPTLCPKRGKSQIQQFFRQDQNYIYTDYIIFFPLLFLSVWQPASHFFSSPRISEWRRSYSQLIFNSQFENLSSFVNYFFSFLTALYWGWAPVVSLTLKWAYDVICQHLGTFDSSFSYFDWKTFNSTGLQWGSGDCGCTCLLRCCSDTPTQSDNKFHLKVFQSDMKFTES